MNRSLLIVLGLACLLTLVIGLLALNSSHFDGLRHKEVLPPTTVELPFGQIYENSFFLDIWTIPGAADSVKMKVYIHAIRTSETREWIQHGPGKVLFDLDGGQEKYVLDVLELNAVGDSVKSVKISIQNRWKEGPRSSTASPLILPFAQATTP